MFHYNITSAADPIADSEYIQKYRPTVGAILVTSGGRGIMLVQHASAPAHTYIPPQGEIHKHESPKGALKRVVDKELPGVAYDPESVLYLGDCVSPRPANRSLEQPKLFFWLVAQCVRHPSAVESDEIDRVEYAWSSDHLKGYLMNPDIRSTKRAMVMHAVQAAYKRGRLSWSCEISKDVLGTPGGYMFAAV